MALLAVLASGCRSGGEAEVRGIRPAEVARATETITPEDMAHRIGVVAHDSMMGRATPSPGLDLTAEWAAAELRRMGLRGGAPDGGFVQRYPLATGAGGDTGTAPNVVAVLEGSDPALRGQHVVFSAHMDHVGVGPPDARGDSIYNGADDDASGVAAVLEVAEAMASLPTPPRRSTIFLLVSGEEGGLWGSDWYAEHPTVPLDSLVANVNVDMVGRNWSDTIVAIGKEHSDLGETLEQVSARHPELGMAPVDDLWPEERFYFRSDHYNFARRGVPVLFFFSGTHEDYHMPGDEPSRIDVEKASRVARLLFLLGVEIGDADEPPAWDRQSYRSIVTG